MGYTIPSTQLRFHVGDPADDEKQQYPGLVVVDAKGLSQEQSLMLKPHCDPHGGCDLFAYEWTHLVPNESTGRLERTTMSKLIMSKRRITAKEGTLQSLLNAVREHNAEMGNMPQRNTKLQSFQLNHI